MNCSEESPPLYAQFSDGFCSFRTLNPLKLDDEIFLNRTTSVQVNDGKRVFYPFLRKSSVSQNHIRIKASGRDKKPCIESQGSTLGTWKRLPTNTPIPVKGKQTLKIGDDWNQKNGARAIRYERAFLSCIKVLDVNVNGIELEREPVAAEWEQRRKKLDGIIVPTVFHGRNAGPRAMEEAKQMNGEARDLRNSEIDNTICKFFKDGEGQWCLQVVDGGNVYLKLEEKTEYELKAGDFFRFGTTAYLNIFDDSNVPSLSEIDETSEVGGLWSCLGTSENDE